MTSLRDIPGLDHDMIQALEHVGIGSPDDFSLMPVDLVCRALTEGLPPGRQAPTAAEVAAMQESARSRSAAGPEGVAPVPGSIQLPIAEALSSKQLMESGISAAAVPVARILGDPSEAGVTSVAVSPKEGEQQGPVREQREVSPKKPVTRESLEQKEPLAPKPREKRPAQVVERGPIGRDVETEEVELNPMEFSSTDERSQEERNFERKNRGMTHKDPGRVMRGALATLLSNLLALVGFGTIVVALTYEYIMKAQVPAQLAWGLVAFPLAVLVFLLVGTPPRCRLCGQRLFVPRQCRKHERAHRSIFGYATSLALHVVCFRWFRCSLCGTKQKLK